MLTNMGHSNNFRTPPFLVATHQKDMVYLTGLSLTQKFKVIASPRTCLRADPGRSLLSVSFPEAMNYVDLPSGKPT